MKRLFLALTLTMASFGAIADGTCNITGSGLPSAVVQKLKTDCENLRLEQLKKEETDKSSPIPEVPFINPERMTGWAQVAEGFANAMGAAAKQLNVSVNEFITTPAGMITIGVILWKVIGTSILKLLAMYAVFLVCKRILQAMWKDGSVEVSRKFLWWTWTAQKATYVTWKKSEENQCGLGFLVLVVGIIAEAILLASLVL